MLIFHVLEKSGFGKNFKTWIKILSTNQKSSMTNGGKTIKYFKFKKGTRQGDPTLVSAADLGFNFRGCAKWNLGFGKHSEPPKGVLGAALEANTFRAICSLKLA